MYIPIHVCVYILIHMHTITYICKFVYIYIRTYTHEISKLTLAHKALCTQPVAQNAHFALHQPPSRHLSQLQRVHSTSVAYVYLAAFSYRAIGGAESFFAAAAPVDAAVVPSFLVRIYIFVCKYERESARARVRDRASCSVQRHFKCILRCLKKH